MHLPRILVPALFACSTLSAGTASAVLRVSTTTPPAYALGVSRDLTEIWAFFNGPLAPLPPGPVRVSGTMSGLHTGTVTLADNVIIFRNLSEPYFPGEMVVVSYHKDIQNLGGESLTGGFVFAFTIASGAAAANWSRRHGYGAASVPYFIYGGDLDNDGAPDVAAPNEGTDNVSIFLNTFGIGSFPARADFGVGDTPSSVFGEDFDNDGDQDLATADIGSGTVSVLRNNGDGTFAPRVSYPAGAQCRQIHGGDFDGDNDVDLCATAHAVDRVHVYYNQGDGTFVAAAPILTVSDGPFAIRTGDFNRDGHLDIGVACHDADSLNILTNNGAGGFTRTGTYLIGPGPWCLNGNDLDGDGDFDLTSVAADANRIVVLFNNGAGGFPTRHVAMTDAYPLGVFAADLDGDGDVDATSSNFAGATVGVYLNPGNGHIALSRTLAVVSAGSYTWAHDLDGDGDLDLSVVDEHADSLFVFYNGSTVAAIDGSDRSPEVSGLGLSMAPNPLRRGEVALVRVQGGRGPATLDLLSVDGRRLLRVWEGEIPGDPLSLRWNPRRADGAPLGPGRYFLALRTAGGVASREALILERR